MRAALALARRGLGRTAPNPAVGCLIVEEAGGGLLGRGFTGDGGRPHAETQALAEAGARARGATAYVTLEPCAHHGRTAPCAEALIAAGLTRVVTALEDPDPRVAGRGHARLREAGLAVVTGVRAAQARALNLGFLLRLKEGRPLVTLKLAVTLDGRIATAGGASRWITGPAARRAAHLLRASHDAIMIGRGTALADNPELTVRIEGLAHERRLRIVLDGGLALPPESLLAAGARVTPTLVFCAEHASEERAAALAARGVEIARVPLAADGRLALGPVLAELGARGLTRVLAEGGGGLAASLLAAGLVDRAVIFRAPTVLGGDGRPAVAPLGLAGLEGLPRLRRISIEALGDDMMECYEFAP